MEWQNLKEKNSGRNYYFYFSEILKHYLIIKFLKTIEPQSGGRNGEAGILCNHSITIISLRIVYKILLLTFKCIYGLAPTYLSDLISSLRKHPFLLALRRWGRFVSFRFRAKRPQRRRARRNGCFRRLAAETLKKIRKAPKQKPVTIVFSFLC